MPSLIGYASLLVGHTMSWRASARKTGARDIGQASISISRESISFPIKSGGGGARRGNEPAQRDRDRDTDHLLGTRPLDDRAVHHGDADGGDDEPDAALQCHALNSRVLHELHGQHVEADAAREA